MVPLAVWHFSADYLPDDPETWSVQDIQKTRIERDWAWQIFDDRRGLGNFRLSTIFLRLLHDYPRDLNLRSAQEQNWRGCSPADDARPLEVFHSATSGPKCV